MRVEYSWLATAFARARLLNSSSRRLRYSARRLSTSGPVSGVGSAFTSGGGAALPAEPAAEPVSTGVVVSGLTSGFGSVFVGFGRWWPLGAASARAGTSTIQEARRSMRLRSVVERQEDGEAGGDGKVVDEEALVEQVLAERPVTRVDAERV